MSEETKTEFKYVLKTPFNYAHKGADTDATFILLKAPSSRNSDECCTLKQAFWRSADRDIKKSKDDEEKAPDTITGCDVIVMIATSKDVVLADVLKAAHRLFTKGQVAFADGEVPLTSPLIDKMSQEDVEAMLGEYLVNFTLASQLAQMKIKSSKA